MNKRTTVLESLAAYVTQDNYSRLSQDEKEILAIHLMDTVGAYMTGSHIPEARALLELARSSDLIGGLGAIQPGSLDEVILPCATTRLTEIDDIHLPSGTTPGSVVIPVALWLCNKKREVEPLDFANAVCAGYELMTRLGESIHGPEILEKGIWPTYFTAGFGVAATVSRLLGLNADQTGNALSMALTLSSGAVGRPGPSPSPRYLTIGYAARGGVFAATCAAMGYKSDKTLLDANWLKSAFGLDIATEPLLDGLGSKHVMNSLCIKPYCAAKQLIAALHGFGELIKRGITPEEITEVRVKVPSRYAQMISFGVFKGNRLSSIASAAYQIALVAHTPEGLYDAARCRFIDTTGFCAFMDKVKVSPCDELAEYLPAHWPAQVEVDWAGGNEKQIVITAPGDPEDPFEWRKTEQKFHRFAGPLIGAEAIDRLAGYCRTAFANKTSLVSLTREFHDELKPSEQIQGRRPEEGTLL